jgi:uncharacterized protein YvpB
MLKRKRFAAPLKSSSGAHSRVPWPTWALVVFWLLIILLVATALALGANYGSVHGGAASQPAAASTQVVAVAPMPTAVARLQTPNDSRPAGVVVLGAIPTAAETPTPPGNNLPAEILLGEVPMGKQTRSLNCEFQTASDLAWYYGRPYTWDEIYQYVGHDVGGNPHKGFVGRSFDDQPGQLCPLGYGVYAEPIAAALTQLGLPAEVSYANSQAWLMAQLATGRPVMVWTTSNMTIRPVATWTAADGVTVKGVPGEHTYLAVGYDADGLWLIDPWDSQRHHFDWQAFLDSWELLDRMALIVTGETAPSLTPAAGP